VEVQPVLSRNDTNMIVVARSLRSRVLVESQLDSAEVLKRCCRGCCACGHRLEVSFQTICLDVVLITCSRLGACQLLPIKECVHSTHQVFSPSSSKQKCLQRRISATYCVFDVGYACFALSFFPPIKPIKKHFATKIFVKK
jgi:hypothetical protein